MSVAAEKAARGVGDVVTEAESQVWSVSYSFECLKDSHKP